MGAEDPLTGAADPAIGRVESPVDADEPLIDVVIPVRDGAATVLRAVRSVLDQSFGRLRLYVVDDGSGDGSGDLVERSVHDPRLTVHRIDGSGVSTARNVGASLGRAGRLAFLDADDEALPGWASALTGTDAALVSCSSYRCAPGEPRRLVHVDTSPLLAGAFSISRDLFDEVGGYDARLAYSENTDLRMRVEVAMRRHSRVESRVAIPLVVHHREGVGRADKYGNEALRDAAEVMLDVHGDELGRRATASFSAVAGVNSLRLGDRARARRHLAVAVTRAPWRLRYWVRLAQALSPRG